MKLQQIIMVDNSDADLLFTRIMLEGTEVDLKLTSTCPRWAASSSCEPTNACMRASALAPS